MSNAENAIAKSDDSAKVPIISETPDGSYCVDTISSRKLEIVDFWLRCMNETAVRERFGVGTSALERLLAEPPIALYVAKRIRDMAEARNLTEAKVLARLDRILDGRMKADRNLVSALRLAAQILNLVKETATANVQVNVSPYASLTDAEMDVEIKRRLAVIEAKPEPEKDA